MTRKKKLWLVAGALAVLALAVLYLSLPRLVGRVIVAEAGKIGLKDLRLRVVSVGWRRLDLADVTVGDAAAPALRIGRITVAYTPAGLWRREIKSIRLAGVMVLIENRGQGLRFPGLEEAEAGSGEMVSIGRLDLEDGMIRLLLAERKMDIPFSARMRASTSGYVLEAGLRPLETPLRLRGTLSREFTSGTIAVDAAGVDLSTLSGRGVLGPSVSARGRFAAAVEVRLRDGEFLEAVANLSSLGELRLGIPGQGEFVLGSLRLDFGIGSDFTPRDIVASARGRRLRFGALASESPFGLDIRGRRWPELEFALSGLDIASPFPFVCERISGTLVPPLETALLRGDFRVRTGAGLPAALGLPWVIGRPYWINGNFQAVRRDGEVCWTLKAGGNGGITLAAGKESVRGMLKLDASIDGDSRHARAAVSCRIAGADLGLAGVHAGAGEFAGSAEMRYDFGGKWHARGLLQVREGRVLEAGAGGLQASGINASLPWSYPGAGPEKGGSFSIVRLQGNGMLVPGISGTLGQEGQGVAFSGLAHTGLPKIAVSFKGSYAPLESGGHVQADFLVPPAVLAPRTPLKALHPLLQGMEAGGRIAVQGTIQAADGRIDGSAGLEIVDVDFEHAGEGLALRGVQAVVRLDSLSDLRTAPSQRVRFDELLWQGFALRNGEMAFRGEGGGKLFIESARFEWNGGTVTLDPLRLGPGTGEPQVTLHCRDVDLAQIINALAGSEIVSGDAKLSGVIPVKMVGGSPVFLDGYLDSPEGSGGRLRVSKPEAISGGQVLVEEAIRDFRYKWIKVRLNSRQGRLNLIVSLDGAPAGKLPLRYDQKRKDFIRDPSGKRHVELKGLLLDIRFNDIDLKDLLETGGRVTAGYQKK